MIPQSFIKDLLNRSDIVSTIEPHVKLKKSGINYSGLCPFHNEKTPSFTVSPTKQIYKCFGCDASGNAITFLVNYLNLDFKDAVYELARNVGLTVPNFNDQNSVIKSSMFKENELKLFDIMTSASLFYYNELKKSNSAIKYLKNRGMTGEVAKKFFLGFAKNNWNNLRVIFSDYDSDDLVKSGLVVFEKDQNTNKIKRYDRFRDRIVFPIKNTKGKIVAFGGRLIENGEPKYLNSPETEIFKKSKEIYGLYEAQISINKIGHVIVTEGYMDVLSLVQFGITNVVATLGTSCTSFHVQKLLRFTDRIIFSFDGDEAGEKAALRALETSIQFASDKNNFKFLFLPKNHDPDSFIRQNGKDAFLELIKNSITLSQLLIKTISKNNDLNTAEGRSRSIYDAKKFIKDMKISSLRSQILLELSDLTNNDPNDLIRFLELKNINEINVKKTKSHNQVISIDIYSQIIKLILQFPSLVNDIENKALTLIKENSNDGGNLIKKIIDFVAENSELNELAGLRHFSENNTHFFHNQKSDSFYSNIQDIKLAKIILSDAIIQLEIKKLKEEQEKLANSGLHTKNEKDSYRKISDRLRELKISIVEKN